ncbi:MAG: GNAT family N-acetyltransferase, partial [Verrucomicrobiota bacterium]|nr:GNAT family N-acetyltransferase [Verrucomicrobiota bacterium]
MDDRLDISTSVVAKLIATQFPEYKNLPIKLVEPNGWDNRTFRLGDTMSVRLPSAERYAAKVPIEQKWLPKLAAKLSVSIPRPIAMGQASPEYPWNWSIYEWIEGQSANTLQIDHPLMETLATELAVFLQELEAIDPRGAPTPSAHNFFRGASPLVYDEETRSAIDALKDFIDVTASLALWRQAISSKWNQNPVWIHGDFSAGNILIKNGHLVGVIDFGGMAVGDPACDLVIAWTLLKGKSRKLFRSALPFDQDTWDRARGWALWKALITLKAIPDKTDAKAMEQRSLIQEILQDSDQKSPPLFHFSHAQPSQRSLLHQWFEQQHIKKWMHGAGLQSTLNGLEQFFRGESSTTYWIGYDQETPFAFLITSPEGEEATTLDLFICDINYLGKGLAVPMVKEFLITHFPHVKKVFIDPEATNTRAIHVYQKIGFKITGEFIAKWHPVPHYQMELRMQDLLHSSRQQNKYIFAPYDESYPSLFQQEKQRISPHLPQVMAIEHVGSTAVPDLGGKGIIDIALLAPKADMNAISTALQRLGYEFRPSFSTEDRLYFVSFMPDPKIGSRRYHIHLTHPECRIWQELVGFRDYLIVHPKARDEYAAIKKKAVAEGLEGASYRQIKDPFLKKILQQLET